MASHYSPPCPSAPRTTRKGATTSKMGKIPAELTRSLFPSTSSTNMDTSTKESMQATLNKIQVEHDVEIGLRSLQRDLHEQRLKNLRELMKSVAQDDWMFEDADKLIGLK